jgi:hypothetical protein
MKKKTDKPKVEKETKPTFSDGVFTGIAVILLSSVLIIALYFGYQEYKEPNWQECYVNSSATVFAKVDSIYNDKTVFYNYAAIDDNTTGWLSRDTDDFLERYTKTDDCRFYEISKEIIKLQRNKQ